METKRISDLNILSSTDINIFDEVMTDFSELNSDLNVTYTVASTKDIYVNNMDLLNLIL